MDELTLAALPDDVLQRGLVRLLSDLDLLEAVLGDDGTVGQRATADQDAA